MRRAASGSGLAAMNRTTTEHDVGIFSGRHDSDDDSDPPIDDAADFLLTDRQALIRRKADTLRAMRRVYDEIFGPHGSLGKESRRQRYINVRRRRDP